MRYELADYEWVAIKPMLPNNAAWRSSGKRRFKLGGFDDPFVFAWKAFLVMTDRANINPVLPDSGSPGTTASTAPAPGTFPRAIRQASGRR
jgi:hypothetical protein